MRDVRLFVATLLLACTAVAQLPAGNYTIDPSLPTAGTNFTNWADTATALSGGIVGPGHTVFVVASTTFNEAVVLPPISGTGAASTVTFIAQGAPAVINAGAQDAFTVMDAQTYLIFENLEIRGWTRYGLNIAGTTLSGVTSRSTFCTFKNILVDGPTTSSGTIFALRNYLAWDCTFESCIFRGGGYVLRSESTARNNYVRCEFDGKGTSSRLVAPYNNNDADNRWENCCLHDCGPSGSALHIDLSSYGNMFWHNTIIVSSTGTAVTLGSLTSWSRANSFRNNIVVNWGTGTCMTYGASTTTGILECNDLDYNVYYAPNGNAVAKQGSVAPAFTPGSLASWQAYFAANMGTIVPASGGSSWDNNSVEGDPGLISATAPFDIHLAPASICKDTGTTTYVAGAWISYAAGTIVLNDFELDRRPATQVDIGADEVACPSPQYETNDAACSLDINGLQGSACVAAVSVLTSGSPGTLNFASTNVGLGWDMALAFAPLVPLSSGAIVSGNGQIVNVDLTAPVLLFLYGGALPSFAVPFPGNFSLGFTAPAGPASVAIQMVIIDPGHADGFCLSQGSQLDVP